METTIYLVEGKGLFMLMVMCYLGPLSEASACLAVKLLANLKLKSKP